MVAATGSADVLDKRTLNRALLERQLLLERQELSASDAIERLVGLQAQVPSNPYLALWSRLSNFQPEELSRLISEREAVRIALQRSTIHLVTAADCLALRSALQEVQERNLYKGSPYGRAIQGMDVDELVAAGRALVEEKPRTINALGKLLQVNWPERDAASLAYAIRNLVPLVQVPPRGLWGGSGQATCTTAEHWLGCPLDSDDSPDVLILRYLAAFGPASVRDMQTWSGLQRLAEAFERLRPRLRTYRDENGKELFDLPEAPLPDSDTPAPVRFLPEYDNVFLGHADRVRIVSEEHRKRFQYTNGYGASFLVDGFIGGGWRLDRTTGAKLTIELFDPPTAETCDELVEEGMRLVRFLAGDATQPDVQLILPE